MASLRKTGQERKNYESFSRKHVLIIIRRFAHTWLEKGHVSHFNISFFSLGPIEYKCDIRRLVGSKGSSLKGHRVKQSPCTKRSVIKVPIFFFLKFFYYINRLVRALWLVYSAGRISQPAKFKSLFWNSGYSTNILMFWRLEVRFILEGNKMLLYLGFDNR